jgi:transposase
MIRVRLSQLEFRDLLSYHRLRGAKTLAAVRYVLVDGMSQYAAAHKAEIHESAVSRAIARLRAALCPHCGHPMPRKD